MAALQWERKFKLVFGDRTKPKEAMVITDPAQLTFDVSKSTDQKKSPNSAAIELFNLSDEELRKLESAPLISFAFECGYEAVGTKLLFLGNVVECSTRKHGNDWVTQLVTGEGYKELNESTLKNSLPPGTKVEDVVEEIRKQMPNVSRGAFTGTNLSSPIPYGYQVKGSPQEALQRLSKEYGLEYSIDRGQLNVGDSGGSSAKESEYKKKAFLLNEDTGLFDSPFYVFEDDKGADKGSKKKVKSIQLKATLNVDIVPGTYIRVSSRLINGWYRVTHCRYSGDYRGEWLMEIKADIIKEDVK